MQNECFAIEDLCKAVKFKGRLPSQRLFCFMTVMLTVAVNVTVKGFPNQCLGFWRGLLTKMLDQHFQHPTRPGSAGKLCVPTCSHSSSLAPTLLWYPAQALHSVCKARKHEENESINHLSCDYVRPLSARVLCCFHYCTGTVLVQ